MVVCVLAIFIFGFLGIFSVKYRRLTKESLECTYSKLRRKPCHTNLDQRIKGKVVGKLMKRTPRTAKLVRNQFNLIVGGFMLLTILATLVSGFYAVEGAYNYAVYGNCNGPNSDDFCIYQPLSTLSGCDCDPVLQECQKFDVECDGGPNCGCTTGECE
jgi:hypothetical protein